MLHFKNWKGSAQSYRALTCSGAFLLFLSTACGRQQNQAQQEADTLIAQKTEVLSNHQQEAQSSLARFIGTNTDTTQADKMVVDYYRNRGQWLFMHDGHQLAQADSIASLLREEVTAQGLSEKAFFLDDIDQDIAHFRDMKLDSIPVGEVMARLEWNLSKAYMRFALGQRYGFTNPKRIFNKANFDIPVEQPDSTFNLQAVQMLKEGKGCEFLRACIPADSAFMKLQTALAKDSTPDVKKRILYNMERLRWRDTKAPKDGERHIWVNIAAQHLWAITPDSVFSMKICCGKPSTKTPLLTSAIKLIQVNPEWNIPLSIIRGEVSHRAGDSAYFARHNYYITNSKGQKVSPSSVTSAQLASGGYRIAQRSGAGNSLGRIIFRFDNRFSVYLHDTSSKGAFNKDVRMISHGCVRVQRPFDVAKFLLPDADPWLLDKIALSMDLPPETEQGRAYKKKHGSARLINSQDVVPTVPVQINYFTTYPNPETGEIVTYPDRYGYDAIIAKALKPFLP